MRTQAEQALRGWWRGEGGAAGAVLQALAAPAEWAYRCGLAVRNRTYDRRGGVSLDGLRVVSVGNLVLGGTGKTPLAAWAARALLSAGWRVALVSRGYGRDEILLHRRWSPDIPVIADPDRVAGATAAQGGGADAVVLDDAFQHRRLARDVDLVLLAAEDPLEGRLLPRGPFREPLAALARAHGVVVTRRTVDAAGAGALAERVAALFPELRVARAALVPDGWQHLDGTPAPPPEGPTLAVTAVARPELFSAQVAAATGGPAELMAFADHHEFVSSDVEAMRARARQRTLVVTEKDAVKLHPHQGALEPVRVLAQALRWEAGEAELTALVTAVRGP